MCAIAFLVDLLIPSEQSIRNFLHGASKLKHFSMHSYTYPSIYDPFLIAISMYCIRILYSVTLLCKQLSLGFDSNT